MNRTLDYLAYRWKAVAAFLAPAVALLVPIMASGKAPSSADLWQAAAASVGALFAVYVTPQIPMPNKKAVPADDDLSDLEGEQGEDPVEYLEDEPGDHRLGKPIED